MLLLRDALLRAAYAPTAPLVGVIAHAPVHRCCCLMRSRCALLCARRVTALYIMRLSPRCCCCRYYLRYATLFALLLPCWRRRRVYGARRHDYASRGEPYVASAHDGVPRAGFARERGLPRLLRACFMRSVCFISPPPPPPCVPPCLFYDAAMPPVFTRHADATPLYLIRHAQRCAMCVLREMRVRAPAMYCAKMLYLF